MGKATKALKDLITSIPPEKLEGLTHNNGTIYDDINFRLDMQSVR
jgi:hypothetical protein